MLLLMIILINKQKDSPTNAGTLVIHGKKTGHKRQFQHSLSTFKKPHSSATF